LAQIGAKVTLGDPLREDAGVLPQLGLHIAADELGIEGCRHGPAAYASIGQRPYAAVGVEASTESSSPGKRASRSSRRNGGELRGPLALLPENARQGATGPRRRLLGELADDLEPLGIAERMQNARQLDLVALRVMERHGSVIRRLSNIVTMLVEL
jgi:hypothetical protein